MQLIYYNHSTSNCIPFEIPFSTPAGYIYNSERYPERGKNLLLIALLEIFEFGNTVDFPKEIIEGVSHHSEIDMFLMAKYDKVEYEKLLRSIFILAPKHNIHVFIDVPNFDDNKYVIKAVGVHHLIGIAKDSSGNIYTECFDI